jgi:hypothetical protein
LNIEEEQRRSDLVHKLIQGAISLTEAQELRTLLEKERHMITQQGNCLAFFAVRFLTDYEDEYLQPKVIACLLLDLRKEGTNVQKRGSIFTR